jgi:hypothetical protein
VFYISQALFVDPGVVVVVGGRGRTDARRQGETGHARVCPPRAGTLSGATGILDRGLVVFSHPPSSVSEQFRHFLSVSSFFRTST